LEGTHWIVSSIEHDSVLECFSEVERLGGTITYVDSNEGGIITPESVVRALRPETVFVSVGWANNELGTIQPLAKIARCIREHEEKHKTTVVLHADAGQAPLYLPTLVTSLHVDLLSIGANKLYGPHGVGTLYISDRTQLAPIVLGGKQERGLRGGTESVALAAGFATSYEIVAQEREAESARLQKLRDELVRELTTRIPKLVVNGDLRRTLPHMLNISIPDVQSEYIVLALDHAGIAISTKSACREGEERVSHVVAVLGGEAWRAKNTFRFSLGRDTTKRGIRKAAETLILILNNTPS
jgi:cysteine desulfurase